MYIQIFSLFPVVTTEFPIDTAITGSHAERAPFLTTDRLVRHARHAVRRAGSPTQNDLADVPVPFHASMSFDHVVEGVNGIDDGP